MDRLLSRSLKVFRVHELAVGILAAFLAGPWPALADEVDDAIDTARIKERAGKIEEALAAIDQVAEGNRRDYRVHYHRAAFLKKLNRLNEAADAIEKAASLAESSGGSAAPPAALRKSIDGLAEELLEYRRKARGVLDKYIQDAAPLAEELLGSGKKLWAAYVLEMVSRAGDAENPVLKKLEGTIDDDTRARYRELFLGPKGKAEAAKGNVRDILKRNLDAARLNLGRKNYDEARISAMAALEVDATNLEALIYLSESLSGLEREAEAVAAALRAVDLPKEKDPSAKTFSTRAQRQIKKHLPVLEKFLSLREKVALDLISIHGQAARRRRSHDQEWIEDAALRLAPGDAELGRVFATSARKAPGAGFELLTRTGMNWTWRNKGQGTKFDGTELILTSSNSELLTHAIQEDHLLGKKFKLLFTLYYDLEQGSEDAIFITFNARFQGGPTCSLLLIPEAKRQVGFARMKSPGSPWVISETHALPRGKPAARKWSRYEVTWDDSTKKLLLTVDGQTAFDYRLRDADVLDGVWGFGFGLGNELRIKDVYLKNE